jgi:hypothetical protein
MATYVDPNTDPDNASAIPDGQAQPASPAPTPAPPQKDQTQSLDILGDGGSALDALHDEALKSKTPTDAPAADPEPKGEGDAGDSDAGPEGGKDAEGDPEPEGAKKRPSAIPEPAKVDDDPAPKADALEDIKPPEGTSPKTAQAWDAFKTKAREEISAAEAKATELAEKLDQIEQEKKALEEKAAKALTEEQAKEIEELRKWRAASEVETAPELVSLDSKISANTDTLLAKLKEAGMSDKQLGDIRTLGIDKVNWEELKPHFSTQLRQFVDAKVMQHVNLAEDRSSTYSKLKEKGQEYLAQRKQEAEAKVAEQVQALDGAIKSFESAEHFAFLRDQDIPKDATADQKKVIEANNKFAAEMRSNIEAWKQNLDDPAMKAELLFGGVMAYKLNREVHAAVGRIKSLESELKAANEKLDKVKKASGAGRRPAGATPPAAKPGSQIVNENGNLKSAAEALDELAAPYQSR